MLEYLKKYASTHLFYLIVIGVVLVAFHSWKEEHDARLLASQQVKISEAAVKSSQDQIVSLQQQIAANDAKSAQQIASLEKLVQSVKTPQQVAVQLPQVAPNLPVQPTVQADDSISFPKADVLPLFQDLAAGKEAEVQLTQCQADYKSEQQIAAQKDAQLEQKNTEIKVLKQPRSFWHRVGTTMKEVGIGIGIGLTVARL